MNRFLRHWRDWLSTWLPAISMAFFALGTLWLVRSAPVNLPAPPAAPPGHDPDYFLRQFAVRQFAEGGRMTSELLGDEGQHYPDTDKLAVQVPRWRAFDQQGRLITGHSQRALTDREGNEVELFGDARITRNPLPLARASAAPAGKTASNTGGKSSLNTDQPLTFSGQYLHAFSKEHRVSSDQPVELARGADTFTGDRFDYDDQTGIANLQGHVRGVMQARR